MTITLVDNDRAIVDTVDGELYAVRRAGNWTWDHTGKLVGLTVVRAIEREIERAKSGTSPPS